MSNRTAGTGPLLAVFFALLPACSDEAPSPSPDGAGGATTGSGGSTGGATTGSGGSTGGATTGGGGSTGGATSPGGAPGSPAVDGGDDAGAARTVELLRTRHGVLHVRAADFFGAGFGVAYAYAQDNRCLLARRLAEVNGRLAEFLGADAPVHSAVHDYTYTALQSDHYFRGWFDLDAIREGFAAGSAEVRDLARGYAAGATRALGAPGGRPCEIPAPATVTTDDVYRMWVATAGVASGELLTGSLPRAVPGSTARATTTAAASPQATSFGSNAWAIGKDGVREGKAIHLYNPHFPWEGIQRLYVLHVTIPGQLDVLGPTLGGFALPFAGFTADLAWGLTFSRAARFTLAELPLNPLGGPRAYTVDGKAKSIDAEVLSIPVKGESAPRQVPFYRADGRPIIDAPAYLLGWTTTTAFAAQDVNAKNTRITEQLLAIARARSVADLREQLRAVQGLPWSYTVAADAQGATYFGDVSNVPNVSAALISSCVTATGSLLASAGFIVLDGGRSSCGWSGRLAASDLPDTTRTDYVANSNNTYELPNVKGRLAKASPVLGPAGEALSLRASLGLDMIEGRISGKDGLGEALFTRELAERLLTQSRNRSGELLIDGIVADCEAHPSGTYENVSIDLTEACGVLRAWDRKDALESVGAALYRGMWMQLSTKKALFASPATLDAPLTSPSGYTLDPTVRLAVRNALAGVVAEFAARNLPLSTSWGAVNRVVGPNGSFGVAGGLESEGLFNVNVSSGGFYTFPGWLQTLAGNQPETLFGATYLHSVVLGDGAPRARGLLVYGQATEPGSPYYLDALEDWEQQRWTDLPFTEAQIAADPTVRNELLPLSP